MKAYYDPWFVCLLFWSLWLDVPQCTRCGGQHLVGQCPLPVVEKE